MKILHYDYSLKALMTILILFCLLGNVCAQEVPKAQNDKFEVLHEVKFDYENYPKEREIAYKYFKKKYKYFNQNNPLQKNNIGVFLFDIDNDQKQEILSYLHNSAYCGSGGCAFEIIKSADKAIPIGLSKVITYEDVKILSTTTANHYDILLSDQLWKWDKGKYRNINKAIHH